MSAQPNVPLTETKEQILPAPLPGPVSTAGLSDGVAAPLDELSEKKLDEIEMIGEEEAAGFATGRSQVSAGMRFLHSSRTIHQLVTDRNRVVGLYLAVASLLLTASGAILNAKPTAALLVPIEVIQKWCLPIAFGTLTVLALFTAFLLIRTRIGLIYEVAKMNVLLGLPIGRVRRIGFLSLFFLMHLLVSLAGGGAGALFVAHLLYPGKEEGNLIVLPSLVAGGVIAVFLVLLYVITVQITTADRKLNDAGK
jgi:hypothetical protein